jgi:hydroxymethylpyrimidine/phosphomethylpyrimidine kinase
MPAQGVDKRPRLRHPEGAFLMSDTAAIPRALTIAGSDSGGGAGIQADLKTFAAYGVYGASAVTAVTAQNTRAVADWLAMPPALVGAQIDAVLSDIGATAAKTGMLANAGVVSAVAEALRRNDASPLVVDPVIVSSSGTRLLDDDGVAAMVREMLPLAQIVTPNLAEVEALTGVSIRSWDDAKGAARRLVELGARSAVITGGHFDDPANVTDLYFDGDNFRDFTSVRIDTTNTHGTGCTFSAAIAAGLAKGMKPVDAIALAKSYVTLAMQHAYPVGSGAGPLHHFYRYWQPAGPRYRPGVAPSRTGN